MKITKIEQFNISLSADEARVLKAIMQNPMCSERHNINEMPCKKCEFCELSKKIFQALK